MQIKVKSAKLITTGITKSGKMEGEEWRFQEVIASDDTRYATFAKDAENLTPDTIITIENLDQDSEGRWKFKKYTIDELATQSESIAESAENRISKGATLSQKASSKDVQINRAVALKAATELCCAKIIGLNEIGTTSHDFETYLLEGTFVTDKHLEPSPEATKSKSSPPKQETDIELPPLKESETPVTDSYEREKGLGGRDLSELKTKTEVQKAVFDDTGGLQPKKQLELLREAGICNNWTEIKIPLPELYQKILLLAEVEMKE